MSPIHRVMAVFVLAVVGLVGCAHEWRSGADVNSRSVADMKAVMRDLMVRTQLLDSECRLGQYDEQSQGAGFCREGGVGQLKTDCENVYAVLRRSGD